ncbi:lytic polysaccharide monooxygenase [Psychromonas aquimarina]|uniref:lytic polysaccharide monooxygenase n=1 Tax=Psychromonas aquimarina TaxID=444919 RepID=UPI00040284AB|nr:lytic polysaccharide monooxygenase [Psychromonas aquimarina]
MKKIILTSFSALAVSAVLAPALAIAHGYVAGQFPSRVNLCHSSSGSKNDCTSASYDRQSLEAPKGFPAAGPADGKIASAQKGGVFNVLDLQSANKWYKTKIQAGYNDFHWFSTANHKTTDYVYYITKPGWNQNAPLTRESFDLANPFCVIDMGGTKPPMNLGDTHSCNVPERSGYQVILSVWTVDDTANAFYNVIDVEFEDGVTPSPVDDVWEQSSTIVPKEDLAAGDKVKARFFDSAAGSFSSETIIEINSAANGKKNTWSYNLAVAINAEQTDAQAGSKSDDDLFTPVYGNNPVYLKADSNLSSVEVDIIKSEIPVDDSITVLGLKDQYVINNNSVDITFSIEAVGNLNITNTIFDADNKAVASASENVNNTVESFTLSLDNATAGAFTLVSIASSNENSNLSLQESNSFNIINAEVPGDCQDIQEIDLSKQYKPGEEVSYQGNVYRAERWTDVGRTPDSQYSGWVLVGPCE